MMATKEEWARVDHEAKKLGLYFYCRRTHRMDNVAGFYKEDIGSFSHERAEFIVSSFGAATTFLAGVRKGLQYAEERRV